MCSHLCSTRASIPRLSVDHPQDLVAIRNHEGNGLSFFRHHVYAADVLAVDVYTDLLNACPRDANKAIPGSCNEVHSAITQHDGAVTGIESVEKAVCLGTNLYGRVNEPRLIRLGTPLAFHVPLPSGFLLPLALAATCVRFFPAVLCVHTKRLQEPADRVGNVGVRANRPDW